MQNIEALPGTLRHVSFRRGTIVFFTGIIGEQRPGRVPHKPERCSVLPLKVKREAGHSAGGCLAVWIQPLRMNLFSRLIPGQGFAPAISRCRFCLGKIEISIRPHHPKTAAVSASQPDLVQLTPPPLRHRCRDLHTSPCPVTQPRARQTSTLFPRNSPPLGTTSAKTQQHFNTATQKFGGRFRFRVLEVNRNNFMINHLRNTNLHDNFPSGYGAQFYRPRATSRSSHALLPATAR